jgi:hypothetical protein
MVNPIMCIYKLCCKDPNVEECYVGKTKDYLQRKCSYKSKSVDSQQQVYKCIRENKGWSNWRMCILEQFEDYDDDKIEERKQYWREQLNAKVETNTIFKPKKETKKRNHKEYYQLNKESMKANCKRYADKNREKIRANKRLYREKNKDKIRE